VRAFGMRNSNTMANAPTASTANIAGCYPTVEPIYKNLYVKSNMAGDFMVVNEFLVTDLKRLGLWSADMLEMIKYHDGSIQQILEIPLQLREKYKEAFEIEPQWLIKAAAYRGRWIDQSQSLNIFYGGTSGKVLSEIYHYAWSMGLKTTYYLRTMGASRIEKSTVNLTKFGGASKNETAVSNNQSNTPVVSTVVVEEMLAVISGNGFSNQAGMQMSTPSPIILGEQMAYAPMRTAPKAQVAEAAAPLMEISVAPLVSQGIPKFGETSIAVMNRPKIEIIGEACESCSA
ncbi:MAG TPA: hypothetical protein VIJ88_03235, partial [Candidatus Paceibacterota bacterium]